MPTLGKGAEEPASVMQDFRFKLDQTFYLLSSTVILHRKENKTQG